MKEFNEVINYYQDILSGKKKRFPNGFFEDENAKTYLAWMTRFLIEDVLKIKKEEIPSKINAQTLWDNRLRVPATKFKFKYIDVIENAYPNQFKPNQFKQVSNGYWQGEEGKKRGIELVKFTIEKQHKIPIDDIPKIIDYHFFRNNRLLGVFEIFDCSPYKVIEHVYPGKFKPWQFDNVPIHSWSDPVIVKEAMDSFLFEKLKISTYQEALKKIRKRHFSEHNLTGLLQQFFDQRVFKVKEWITAQMNNHHGI